MSEHQTQQQHSPIDHHYSFDEAKFYISMIITLIILFTVGWSIWLVRQYLPLIGFIVLGIIVAAVGASVVVGIVFVVRYITKVTPYDISDNGTVLRDLFGRNQLIAPMTTNYVIPKIRRNKVTVTPVVPSIIELIESGVIAIGQLTMHMGFEMTKGGLVPVIDKWPGTFAVAGMGRSGKTRRVLTVIFQAIIGRARVFICDPHRTKRDGLAKMLAPLAPWLTIAQGEDEVMQIVRLFRAEMKRRMKIDKGANEPYWDAWVIIFDEWSYLMTTDEISEDDQSMLIELVRDCSTQYAGYNGFAGIIGQVWTNDECPTVIRRSLHKVFIHQLSNEYAKFFVKQSLARKAEELEPRQALYRQGAEVKQIITHDVPDDACEWFADWLTEHLPPENLPAANVPGQINGRQARAIAPLNQRQIAAPERRRNTDELPPFSSQEEATTSDSFELGTVDEWKREEVQKPPTEPIEAEKTTTANIVQDAPSKKSLPTPDPGYTSEEEAAILAVAYQLEIERAREGTKVTREAIQKKLAWGGPKYWIIREVCNKHGIAKP